MDDQQATDVFRALASLLRKVDLGWVVEQVEAQIRVGKIQLAQITPLKEGFVRPPMLYSPPSREAPDALREPKPPRAVRREKLLKQEPYSPRESLRLLVEAVEHVTVDVEKMKAETLTWLRDSHGPLEISFLPDTVLSEETSAPWERMRPVEGNVMGGLQVLLSELRTSIDGDAK